MADLHDGEMEYYACSFEKQNLAGMNIDEREFDSCLFKDCNFSEATLRNCKFVDCEFSGCNLSVIKFDFSRFIDVLFTGCKMPGIDWNQVAWPSLALCSPLTFRKCNISDSSFFGLSLKELVIEESKAHNVDFREGDFGQANFTYTDFSGSLFSNTDLTQADFSEATGYDIDIYHNVISNAKFSRYEAVRLLESLEIVLVD